MDIQELRREIDGIDAQLLPLFCQRMEIAAQVADYKKKTACPFSFPDGSGKFSTGWPVRRARTWRTTPKFSTIPSLN